MKYNTFDKEQDILKSKRKRKNFNRDNLYYNQELDHYICPMAQPMKK